LFKFFRLYLLSIAFEARFLELTREGIGRITRFKNVK
jgi:hypothetical protein